MLTYNKNGDIFTTRKRCIATTALPEHLTRQKGFQIYMMQTKTQDMGSGSIPKLLAQTYGTNCRRCRICPSPVVIPGIRCTLTQQICMHIHCL